MKRFKGVYEGVIDAKGRLLVPVGLRKQLPENFEKVFSLNRGFEKCINLYTPDVWDPIADKINKMNEMDDAARRFRRLANSTLEVEMDSSDRILLPNILVEYAEIKKDIIIATQGNKVELWDKDNYNKYMNETAEMYTEISTALSDKYGNPFVD